MFILNLVLKFEKIYHNDIALRNFVIDTNNKVFLIDFAFASLYFENHPSRNDYSLILRVLKDKIKGDGQQIILVNNDNVSPPPRRPLRNNYFISSNKKPENVRKAMIAFLLFVV